MNAWKTAAGAAVLAVAVGVGAAVAPVAHGQATTIRPAQRALEILGGRGSQIGVSIRDLQDDDVRAGKLPGQGGVVIEDVSEDSPASKAGLHKGDVVIEFDGERVRSVRQFTRLVQETPAGRKSQTTVMRDGQKVNVTVEPRESSGYTNLFGDLDGTRVFQDFGREFGMPPAPPAAPAPPARPARPAPAPPAPPMPAFPDMDTFVWRASNSLGITISDLSDQLAGYFGTKDGVLVTSVTDGSAASKAGIKAGDVLTSFNGSDVTQSSDLRRRIQRLEDGDEFTAGVVRDKKPLTLKGKMESLRSRRTYRSEI
jgi:serine protease Do